MMNLNLFLVLAIFASIVLAEISDKDFVVILNKGRRRFAKRAQIPNMHELIWDDGLAKEAATAFHNPHSERKVIEVKSYENVQSSSNDEKLDDFAARKIGGLYFFSFFSMPISNFLIPSHKKIGCAKLTVHMNFGEQSSVKCFVEPEGSLDDIFKVKGEPGSKCSAGYENKDGLCKLVPPTTTTKPTTRASRPSAMPTSTETSSASEFFVMTILLVLAIFYFFKL